MTSKGKLPFLKIGGNSRPRDPYKIVVLGAEDVGKTALIVRFLTKKYLPEYSRGVTTCYERSVSVEGKFLPLRVIDTAGRESFTSLKQKGVLTNADGFIIVYSIIDKRSYLKARELMKLVHEDFGSSTPVPMTLIGNKDDLLHLRTVNTIDAQRIGLTYSRCTFYECSAAREADNVEHAFQEFFRQVMQNKDSKRRLTVNSTLNVSSPNTRRNSAGNSTLTNWWKRPRSSSACERQDRTFTM